MMFDEDEQEIGSAIGDWGRILWINLGFGRGRAIFGLLIFQNKSYTQSIILDEKKRM